MARGPSRFWLWTAPLTVGIAAALVLGTGFVLALRGAAGKPLGVPPPRETPRKRAADKPPDGIFRILVVGDSLAKGTGDESGKGFAVNVLEAFRRKGAAEITNLAVNGMESPEVLAIVESPNVRALAARANLILVSAGGNDLSHGITRGPAATELADAVTESRNRYARSLRGILAALREANPSARICVLGLYDPFGDEQKGSGRLGASVILQWNELIAETALAFPNVSVIPTFDLFQGRPDRLSADHYHPNAQAYEEIAKRVLQVV
jgi:lysophospholipase L1-like esterase